MKHIHRIFVIGGDSRQKFMSEHLARKGFEVYACSLSGRESTDGVIMCEPSENLKMIENCDAVVLPLPATKDGRNVHSIIPVHETLDSIAGAMNSEQTLFAGMLGASIRKKFISRDIEVFDYFDREEVKIMNTVPTAQGILKTVIENIDYTLAGSSCAVMGYGRVGRAAADMLKALSAEVTVCARKFSDIAWAQTCGMLAVTFEDFPEKAGKFDVIVNTVPTTVLDRGIMELLKKDCLIIDVASAPFGTDFTAAHDLEIKALQCPSLPGKVAPKTAGRIIADGIINIIKEREYE